MLWLLYENEAPLDLGEPFLNGEPLDFILRNRLLLVDFFFEDFLIKRCGLRLFLHHYQSLNYNLK